MINATVTSNVNLPKVGERIRRQWRGHNNPIQSIASRTVRRMKALFRKSPKKRPAPVGQPPHTRGGPRSIKNAVAYVMVNNGAGALVGMDADKIGQIAAYHEYGGRQPIKGKRRQYTVGKVGPLDYRHGYTTPLGKLRQAIPGPMSKPKSGITSTSAAPSSSALSTLCLKACGRPPQNGKSP